MLILGSPVDAGAREGTASWYSVESCHREGTSGIMANGQPLDGRQLTAASWDYPFGTRLLVRYGAKAVVVVVTDRGPARILVRQGRLLDLSEAAFEALAPLARGVIKVRIEVVRGGDRSG